MATGLVIPVISPAAARNATQDTWNGVDRVVAVGDIHGDYEQYLAVLKSAGLAIGSAGKPTWFKPATCWIAGRIRAGC